MSLSSSMKHAAKIALGPGLRRVRYLIREAATADYFESQCQQVQRGIVNQYISFREQGIVPYRNIRDAGFRIYSQFEEDGIILYVLSMIGFKSRRVVEMCCGFGDQCMAANLILNHGFEGYLFDGDEVCVASAVSFFRSKKECLLQVPAVMHAWITAENVNDLLARSGCSGEVDLLSLDLDGNDYWVWRAIETIRPRLVVAETNPLIPSDQSLAMKYDPEFRYRGGHYLNASLLAWVKLFRERDYRLIGTHRHRFNAFFLRNDEGVKFFPEVSVVDVRDNESLRQAEANRWPLVKNMPWVEV